MISDWLLHLVPWWLWLLAAAAVVGGLWRLFGWRGALAAAAGLTAVLSYSKGRSDANTERDAVEAKRRAEAIKGRKEIDDEVSGMDSTSLDREYDRWLRDRR